eukprot:gene2673-1671_t
MKRYETVTKPTITYKLHTTIKPKHKAHCSYNPTYRKHKASITNLTPYKSESTTKTSLCNRALSLHKTIAVQNSDSGRSNPKSV